MFLLAFVEAEAADACIRVHIRNLPQKYARVSLVCKFSIAPYTVHDPPATNHLPVLASANKTLVGSNFD